MNNHRFLGLETFLQEVGQLIGELGGVTLSFVLEKAAEFEGRHTKEIEDTYRAVDDTLAAHRRRVLQERIPDGEPLRPEVFTLLDGLPQARITRPTGKLGRALNHPSRHPGTALPYALGVFSLDGDDLVLGYPTPSFDGHRRFNPFLIDDAAFNLLPIVESPQARDFHVRQVAKSRDESPASDLPIVHGLTTNECRALLHAYYEGLRHADEVQAGLYGVAPKHPQWDECAYYRHLRGFYAFPGSPVHVFSATPGLVIHHEYYGDAGDARNDQRLDYFRALLTSPAPIFYQFDPRTAWGAIESRLHERTLEQHAEVFALALTNSNIELSYGDFRQPHEAWKSRYTLSSPALGVACSNRPDQKKIRRGLLDTTSSGASQAVPPAYDLIHSLYKQGTAHRPAFKPLGTAYTREDAIPFAFACFADWKREFGGSA